MCVKSGDILNSINWKGYKIVYFFCIGGGGHWGYCDIIGGECKDGKDKDEILLLIVDTVQKQQQIGLEKQKSSNDILKRVVDQLS